MVSSLPPATSCGGGDRAGDVDDGAGDVGDGAAAERVWQGGARDFVAERLAVGVGPVADQVPAASSAISVVEQPDPDGGERQDVAAIAHVGAAHSRGTASAALRGTGSRDGSSQSLMVGLFAGQLRQLAVEEGAEALAGGVDVLALSRMTKYIGTSSA